MPTTVESAAAVSPSSTTSYSQHGRSVSLLKFDEDNYSNTLGPMRCELDRLAGQIADERAREHFAKDMDGFYRMFESYTRTRDNTIDWSRIQSPSAEMVVPYDAIVRGHGEAATDNALLQKLAVLKLNGGLGTTMGCVGPKSAIEVRDRMNFLDLTVRQLEYLNAERSISVPLILMNSFNTDSETRRIIQKYGQKRMSIITFNQSRYPRIGKDSLLPVATSPHSEDEREAWYPPGHGNVFEAMNNAGLLDDLLAMGKEYLFISNIDNLGATVDGALLAHMEASGAEFVMEVTDKTKADIKGGTLINYDGGVRLLEIAQVPPEHVSDFVSVKKFKIFNTNNIWVKIRAIKRILTEEGAAGSGRGLDLDVITNPKTMNGSGEKVIQLESAVGSAIKFFRGGHGVNVPRSRFLPVKSCSDLFLVQSDLYQMAHGALTLNPRRPFSTVPYVKLGDHFKKVPNFLSRFAGPVQILELDHLTVTGDVTFGKDVTLKGTVIIVANHGSRIDIPSGSVLEDKVVSGNLRILDH